MGLGKCQGLEYCHHSDNSLNCSFDYEHITIFRICSELECDFDTLGTYSYTVDGLPFTVEVPSPSTPASLHVCPGGGPCQGLRRPHEDHRELRRDQDLPGREGVPAAAELYARGHWTVRGGNIPEGARLSSQVMTAKWRGMKSV